jgi:hypothetical protein
MTRSDHFLHQALGEMFDTDAFIFSDNAIIYSDNAIIFSDNAITRKGF